MHGATAGLWATDSHTCGHPHRGVGRGIVPSRSRKCDAGVCSDRWQASDSGWLVVHAGHSVGVCASCATIVCEERL